MVPINIYHSWRSFWADESIIYKLHLEIIYDNKKHQKSTLSQRFCKFSTGIDKYGSDVIKTVVKVARSNPFSVYCYDYVKIYHEAKILHYLDFLQHLWRINLIYLLYSFYLILCYYHFWKKKEFFFSFGSIQNFIDGFPSSSYVILKFRKYFS